MKDILKIMRFDFLTAKPVALPIFTASALLLFLASLFFSPVINSYIIFAAMVFVIPLQSVAEKNGFHKLYGILPVQRKNITRARFLYIYLVHLLTELTQIVFALIASGLKLYRILPDHGSVLLKLADDSFEDTSLTITLIVGLFTFFCLMFTYMEMMGQIFGRENEMKILLITLIVGTLLLLGFLWLSEHDIIPTLNIPDPTALTSSQKKLAFVILNLVMPGISLLFGEITASRLAKREL